jgi:hypothetical protein
MLSRGSPLCARSQSESGVMTRRNSRSAVCWYQLLADNWIAAVGQSAIRSDRNIVRSVYTAYILYAPPAAGIEGLARRVVAGCDQSATAVTRRAWLARPNLTFQHAMYILSALRVSANRLLPVARVLFPPSPPFFFRLRCSCFTDSRSSRRTRLARGNFHKLSRERALFQTAGSASSEFFLFPLSPPCDR